MLEQIRRCDSQFCSNWESVANAQLFTVINLSDSEITNITGGKTERLCYVAQDFDAEMKTAAESNAFK